MKPPLNKNSFPICNICLQRLDDAIPPLITFGSREWDTGDTLKAITNSISNTGHIITVLTSHLTNPQINKCFNGVVNSSHEHCCSALLQALYNIDVCPSDIEDSTSESETSPAPSQPTPIAEETTSNQTHIVQHVDASPSHSEEATPCPLPQPSPDLEQLLSFRTMTLDENIITTQSEPTQITDTQAAITGDLNPLLDPTAHLPHLHTLTVTLSLSLTHTY